MTAQMPEKVLYQGSEYALILWEEDQLFTPQKYGMHPVMIHTACWRGYYVTYQLGEEGLIVREFTVRLQEGNYPVVEGVQPTLEEYQATYRGMNLAVKYNGTLTLARDMIPERYVHMGIQGPDAFKVVLEFTLSEGKIIKMEDRSAEMEERRKSFPVNPLDPMSFMKSLQDSPLFKLSQEEKKEGQ